MLILAKGGTQKPFLVWIYNYLKDTQASVSIVEPTYAFWSDRDGKS